MKDSKFYSTIDRLNGRLDYTQIEEWQYAYNIFNKSAYSRDKEDPYPLLNEKLYRAFIYYLMILDLTEYRG